MDDDQISNVPTEVSVIIPASDRARQLRQLIEVVIRISPATELIVVCPGVVPDTANLARDLGAIVVATGSPITYDEGRSIGARHATGQYLIFLEDRISLPLPFLKKYLSNLRKGWDVVMTKYPGKSAKHDRSSRSMACQLLNHLIERPDLASASLCIPPYAMTRKALDHIGWTALSVPPLALIKAVQGGATLSSVHATADIKRLYVSGLEMIKTTQQILHDNLRAIHCWLQVKGERGGLIDGNRYRLLLQVSNKLHMRTVHRVEPMDKKGGGLVDKRKRKRSNPRKKT